MTELKNYREVGKFDVMEAPRNPIGAFDAEQFKTEAMKMIEAGTLALVVDLGDLDFLYSDAFNAFSLIHQKLIARQGSLGILASDDLAVKSLLQAGVDRYVEVYRSESALMAVSLSNAQPDERVEKDQDTDLSQNRHTAPVDTVVNVQAQPRRRFAKSKNSDSESELNSEVKSTLDPFGSLTNTGKRESNAGTFFVAFLGVIVVVGALVAWAVLQ